MKKISEIMINYHSVNINYEKLPFIKYRKYLVIKRINFLIFSINNNFSIKKNLLLFA
jgi:hypothetical protein